ncbi:MAG: hypothetical protein ACTSU2_03070 [Promethearchaeota archaeon]
MSPGQSRFLIFIFIRNIQAVVGSTANIRYWMHTKRQNHGAMMG